MRLLLVSLSFFLVSVGAFSRQVPLTILCTCDLHGNILPTEDYDGHTNLGGIARCATMIREVRNKEKNVLLVDVGDATQGTAVSYLSGGQVMVNCLNRLHYDAWVWGNHEFDWGLQKLAVCAERANMPILNANVRSAKDEDQQAQRVAARLKPYVFREIDGIKVATIGLNTPGVPSWSRPRLIQGLEFLDSIETLKTIIPEIRKAGAQIIILACHQGYRDNGDDAANQVNAIARNFPELDVIIGAHTHRNFPEFMINHVLYCQADYYGIHLGRVDLVFDTEKARVTKRQSNTLLMDEHVPLDSEILRLAGGEIDRAEKMLNTSIGEATAEFSARAGPRKETPIHDLIFNALAESLKERGVKVDAIVHGIFERRAALKPGAITIRDIWKMIPYENTVGVAQLTPAELREVLDENLDAYGNSSFRGIWGLKWIFDPDADKESRTVSLSRADGTSLSSTQALAVVFNSYDLAGGGLRWRHLRALVDRPEARLVEYDLQTREAVIDYIRNRRTISPSVENWWRTVNRPKKLADRAD